ncbi:hypothetical protein L873DRAFT_1806836 [Choiromyces venosus 120613-1]|uniref:Uncharacterized protein n=1 Tax=Choiromyces venosus 120613-1 TaxID=1336337 RepID=A0A3N4JM51_9PEZI|nr:hypothetical protein L873DRAFT_1806836 [Choiromyces venosus 120613-1]
MINTLPHHQKIKKNNSCHFHPSKKYQNLQLIDSKSKTSTSLLPAHPQTRHRSPPPFPG